MSAADRVLLMAVVESRLDQIRTMVNATLPQQYEVTLVCRATDPKTPDLYMVLTPDDLPTVARLLLDIHQRKLPVREGL